MSRLTSAIVIVLLAIIASVMLFGAELTKAFLFYGGIFVIVILVGVFLWNVIKLPFSRDGEAVFWLFPMLSAFAVSIIVVSWAGYIAIRDGISFYKATDQFQLGLRIFGGLFLLAMFVAAIETWRRWLPAIIPTLKNVLGKWWLLLIGPIFVFSGVKLRISERRSRGEAVGLMSAFLTMLFSFFLSIFLSLLSLLALVLIGAIAFTAFNPQ
jgi:hypothetical protein